LRENTVPFMLPEIELRKFDFMSAIGGAFLVFLRGSAQTILLVVVGQAATAAAPAVRVLGTCLAPCNR
jgi:hypothetical protein